MPRPVYGSGSDEGESPSRIDCQRGLIITLTQCGDQTDQYQLLSGGSGRRQKGHRHDYPRGSALKATTPIHQHLFTASTHDYLMFFTNSGGSMSSASRDS